LDGGFKVFKPGLSMPEDILAARFAAYRQFACGG